MEIGGAQLRVEVPFQNRGGGGGGMHASRGGGYNRYPRPGQTKHRQQTDGRIESRQY